MADDAMADDALRVLICLVEGESSTFKVRPTGDMDIMDLKDLIWEKKNGAFNGVNAADQLILWKVNLALPSQKELKHLTGKSVPDSVELDYGIEKISNHWPANTTPTKLQIIVELPSEGVDRALFKPLTGFLVQTRDLWPAVTINAPTRGNFGGQANIEPNAIFELSGTEPDFLTEFRTKLGQRRWIDSNTDIAPLFLRNVLHGFDNYFEGTPTGAGQSGRVSSQCELLHFTVALLYKGWKTGNIKEENVRWIFDQLGSHFHEILGSREKHAFRSDWQFKLIVSVASPKKEYSYTPRSDFHLSVDRLVHFLVEVQSNNNQSDRYRMLLQAACAARLGYLSYDKPFIVVALYIESTGMVTRYFLYQRDGASSKVFYVTDVQDWRQPSTLFAAMFEIYNLVSMIQSDRPELGSMKDRIDTLGLELGKNFDETFMSKRTHANADEDDAKPPKRTRTSHGGQGDNTGNALQRGEHVYHDRQVVDAFTQAGYTLESDDEDDDGWTPLDPLKPTMRLAIQSNGATVVAKLLYGSHELQILRYLHRIDSPINHTIPLLRVLELDTWKFVLLPKATPLDSIFARRMIYDNVVDFSRQLIEGVAFLHSQGIAHLDIKPQNIVVVPNKLFIIDFDISVRVDGTSTLIDRWCGTPGWMAPEIGHRDGPRCRYSPIRADLWSCGRVLLYLARMGDVEEENPFESLTMELLNKVPKLRPLLHRLPWVLQRSFKVGQSLSESQGTMKRKPDTLPHDAKRLAISAAHP